MYTLCCNVMPDLHNGHLSIFEPQLLQQTQCPQGIRTVSIFASMQILHKNACWMSSSFCFSSPMFWPPAHAAELVPQSVVVVISSKLDEFCCSLYKTLRIWSWTSMTVLSTSKVYSFSDVSSLKKEIIESLKSLVYWFLTVEFTVSHPKNEWDSVTDLNNWMHASAVTSLRSYSHSVPSSFITTNAKHLFSLQALFRALYATLK